MWNPYLFLVPLMCLAALPVCAEDKFQIPRSSGNAFLQTCSAVDKPTEAMTSIEMLHGNICLAYIVGLVDGVSLQVDLSRVSSHAELFPYCLSDEVGNGQLVRVLLKYIRDNPAKAHLPTATLFGMAMKEAFPCPTQK